MLGPGMLLLHLVLLPLAVISGSIPGLALDRYSTGRILPPKQFRVPKSAQVDAVNGLIGNGGIAPSHTGGMSPTTGPPFAMHRWVAQTRPNYVSRLAYNITASTPKIHGFQCTMQPAIWMGESRSHAVVPGVAPTGNLAEIKSNFTDRGLFFIGGPEKRGNEVISPSYYSIELEDGVGGTILAEMTSTSRAGYLRFTYKAGAKSPKTATPYVLIDGARRSVQSSTGDNYTFPIGHIDISVANNEVTGYSSERQDSILTPISIKPFAEQFKGYFVAQFDPPLNSPNVKTGLIVNDTLVDGSNSTGSMLNAYAMYEGMEKSHKPFVLTVKLGLSLISVDQARKNLETEITDASNGSAVPKKGEFSPGSFEATAQKTRSEWAEKLDRVKIEGGTPEQLEIYYTSMVHGLTYPYETHEYGRYYSACDNNVHDGVSYNGYSNWDTYRQEWGYLMIMAPERIGDMVTSMLNDYKECGRTPMWKNIVETNIMIGTHGSSMIGETIAKNFTNFDRELAWEAVLKDVTVAPVNESDTVYSDRQENVDFEANAGLDSVYSQKGWVANDVHSESGSRDLGYSYVMWAAYHIAKMLEKPDNITSLLYTRAKENPLKIWNNDTGFFETRNASGAWGGPDNGWTEGTKYIYLYDFVQDVEKLIDLKGGKSGFVQSLENHYNGNHDAFTNEPSLHISYLYNYGGAAMRTQERVRDLVAQNYNNTPQGISGNEDCGQMSAFYLMSAMGMYAVSPVDKNYSMTAPFHDKLTIDLPQLDGSSKRLSITSPGALKNQYVKSITLNGQPLDKPFLAYEQFIGGGDIVYELSDKPETFGNDPEIVKTLGPYVTVPMPT